MTCLMDFVWQVLKKYFESFLSRPRFLELYRKSILVPGAAVCCGFHLGCVSYGYTFFGGEVSLLGACAKPSASAGLGCSGCSRCLSAECCSGTLRHHAKICHSEIGGHRFFCNELVSLVKGLGSFIILYGIALKVQCRRYPERSVQNFRRAENPNVAWRLKILAGGRCLVSPWQVFPLFANVGMLITGHGPLESLRDCVIMAYRLGDKSVHQVL